LTADVFRVGRRPARALAAVLLALPLAVWSRQAVTVTVAGAELRVQAPTVTFIAGDILKRLRDGLPVPLEIELAVLSRSNGPVVARAHATFTLSFDLWEERIAVRSAGPPARSASHLRPGEVEAWCIRNLTVPLAELGTFGKGSPFWVAMHYRVVSEEPRADEPSSFSLGRLIDALSRRRENADFVKLIDAGPFRLPN
jgi:hypothetical protein